MRSHLVFAALLLGSIAAPVGESALSPPIAAAQTAPPPAVEDFPYPGADEILADTGIKLLTYDGHIMLANCADPDVIRLYSYELAEMACFKVTGASGYLALELPDVYTIHGDGVHDVNASIEIEEEQSSVDVEFDDWTPVGEGANDGKATLLELVAGPADGSTAILPVNNDHPSVGRLAVGPAGRAGSRGCSATLIATSWIVTASSCFVDDPATLSAGAPAKPTTASFGGKAPVGVTQLQPHSNRDLVLGKLATPVIGIAPAVIADAAPTPGAVLPTVGFGRTGTAVFPDTMATADVTVASVNGATVAGTLSSGLVCKGDAGGPALRNGHLVGVVTRSGQAGCFAAAGSTSADVEVQRVDDVSAWIVTTTKDTDRFDSAKWNDNFGSTADMLTTGDVNGDGRDDLVSFSGATGNVYVSLSNGTSFGATQTWIGNFGSSSDKQMVADVNGDGLDDLVAYQLGSTHDVYVALSTGTSFSNGAVWHNNFGSNGDQVTTGDMNGDGRDDLVAFSFLSSNQVYVALSSGTGFAIPAAVWKTSAGANGNQGRVGDVNGDGKDDVVIYQMGPSSGTNNVSVALSTGSGLGGTSVWLSDFGADGHVVTVGDVNGDGKEDAVAFTATTTHDAEVALSSGSGLQPKSIWNNYFGLPGEQVALGDFNADLREDAVAFTGGSAHDVYAGVSNGGQTVTVGTPTLMPTFNSDQVEGNSGSRKVSVSLVLNAYSSRPVSVGYQAYAVPGTGVGAVPGDIDVTPGTLQFAPGERVKTVTVTLKGDTLDEPAEVALVAYTNAVNANIGGYHVGGFTIADDDPTPTITPSGAAAVAEGNSGTKNILIPVNLSAPSGQVVSVDYAATSWATPWATLGTDYELPPGTVTFQPGQTSKTITIVVKGDTVVEPNEGVGLILSNPVNGVIGGFGGIAGSTINNDD